MADKLIPCEACGNEISGKAKQCPQCGHKVKKPIYKKWWFWTIIALVVVIIAASVGGGTGAKKVGNTDGSDVSDGGDSNVFHAGDIIETKYFSITYQECDTDWKDYDEYMGPSEGKKVVRAYFVIENIGNSDHGCGTWEFDCYADGVACDAYLFGDQELPSYESISPGRKLQGYVSFQVPTDAKSVELEYEASIGQAEKAIFVIE